MIFCKSGPWELEVGQRKVEHLTRTQENVRETYRPQTIPFVELSCCIMPHVKMTASINTDRNSLQLLQVTGK